MGFVSNKKFTSEFARRIVEEVKPEIIAAAQLHNTASGTNIAIDDAAQAAIDYTIPGTTLQEGTPTPSQYLDIVGLSSAEITINNDAARTINFTDVLYSGDIANYSTQKITRKMAIVELTGTETWTTLEGYAGRYFCTGILPRETAVHPASNSVVANIKCTHFSADTYSRVTAASNYADNGIALISNEVGNHAVISYSDKSTLAEFTAWLAEQYQNGTPVTILHELVTPTTENIELPELTFIKGSNSVIASSSIDIDYIADTKLYIDNKFNELQNAIISLGGNV